MTVTRRSAGFNAAVMTAAEIVGKIATLAYTLIAARALAPDAFGAIALALAFAGLLQAFPSWGFDALLVQRASADPSNVAAYLSRTLAIRFAIAVPLFVVGGALLSMSRPNGQARWALILVLLATLGDLYGDAIRSTAAASQDQSGVALALAVQRVAACGFALALLAANVSAVSVAAGYFLGSLVGAAAAWRACRRLGVRFDRELISRESLREWGSASWPLGINLILGYLLFRLDAVLLGWLTSDADVAAYNVAYRLFEAGLVLSWTVGRAVLPAMSEAGDEDGVRRGVSTAIGTLSFLYGPLVVVFAVEASSVIRTMFGDDYVATSRTALLWLAAAPLVFALAQNLGYGLLARNGTRQLLIAGVIAAVVNVAINVAVITSLKGSGAAAATLISYVVEASVIGYFLVRQRCLPRLVPVIAAPAVASIAMAAVMVVLDLALVFNVLAGGLVFLAVWVGASRWAPEESITLLEPMRSWIARMPIVGHLAGPRRSRDLVEENAS